MRRSSALPPLERACWFGAFGSAIDVVPLKQLHPHIDLLMIKSKLAQG